MGSEKGGGLESPPLMCPAVCCPRKRLIRARSEVDLEPDLLATSEVGDAGRLAERRVPLRRDEVVETAVARPVEGVEHLADETDREVVADADVLLEAEVDRAVGEAPGLVGIDRVEERVRALARRQVEPLREVEDV